MRSSALFVGTILPLVAVLSFGPIGWRPGPVGQALAAATDPYDICVAADRLSTYKCRNRWISFLRTSYR